jgi:hypothetical protein
MNLQGLHPHLPDRVGLVGARLTHVVPLNGSPPALHLNPSDDQAFAAVVGRLLAAGLHDAPAFERRLRESYPFALVRPRDLAHEPFVLWYVYRDGRWTPSD